MRRRADFRSAFTLVEVLVTIAALSILVGVLVPHLANARQEGRRVRCMANLRQLGIAFHMYFEKASEAHGKTAYFPAVADQFSGKAALTYPVGSERVKMQRDFAALMFPTHDPYTEAHTYPFPGGRYWQTFGDGASELYWDVSVSIPDLWGGVAGTAVFKDAQGNDLAGARAIDGFAFEDRILNPYVFTGFQSMTDTSKAAEVFRCPSDPGRWEGYGNSYAGNARPGYHPYYNTDGEMIPFWRALNVTDVMSVRQTSRVILAGDGGWMQSVRNEGPPWMFWHLRPSYHNMLFLDGHVAFLKVSPGQIEGEDWQLDAGED